MCRLLLDYELHYHQMNSRQQGRTRGKNVRFSPISTALPNSNSAPALLRTMTRLSDPEKT
jgi:hypothetical protein